MLREHTTKRAFIKALPIFGAAAAVPAFAATEEVTASDLYKLIADYDAKVKAFAGLDGKAWEDAVDRAQDAMDIVLEFPCRSNADVKRKVDFICGDSHAQNIVQADESTLIKVLQSFVGRAA